MVFSSLLLWFSCCFRDVLFPGGTWRYIANPEQNMYVRFPRSLASHVQLNASARGLGDANFGNGGCGKSFHVAEIQVAEIQGNRKLEGLPAFVERLRGFQRGNRFTWNIGVL